MSNHLDTFIIAEAGVNHNGSLKNAFMLVDAAYNAGVNCVKFQIFNTNQLLLKDTPKANYQKANTGTVESQYEMLSKLEFSHDEFKELAFYCRDLNIEFMATAFDLDSIDFLEDIGVKKFKIPSGEITNFPYLRHIARKKKSTILSTGMGTLQEIQDAFDILMDYGLSKEQISILQCTSMYPTPYEKVNLKAILSFKRLFNVAAGLSDHSLGIEVPIAAVALGANVIEKHYTIDRNMPGPDHKQSLDPHELKNMVSAIRNVEKAMGNGIKEPFAEEIETAKLVRKSIVASKSIKAGERLTETNITTKRPGLGKNPMCWNELIGQYAEKDYHEDDYL